MTSVYVFVAADKTAAVGEPTDTGAEMTEEEWNLRVAELNKHQVAFAFKKKKKEKATEIYHNKSNRPQTVHEENGLKKTN